MAEPMFFLASAIIGLIFGTYGTGSGIQGAIMKYTVPPSSMPPLRRNTIVRVGVGLGSSDIATSPDNQLLNSGGPTPMIVGFDEAGNYVGMTNWELRGHINTGAYTDIEIYHLKHREKLQTTSLQVIAQDGPLCIAYLLKTWSDDSHRGWTGSQGPACGYKWGYSNIVLGHREDGSAFKPYCTWIDRAHHQGIYPAALQIHMDDFTSTNKNMPIFNDSSKLCNPPAMLFLDRHHYEMPHDFKFRDYPDFTDFAPILYPGQFKAYTAPPELASLTQSPPTSCLSATPTTLTKQEHPTGSSSSTTEKRDIQKRDEALANLNPHSVITTVDSQHSAHLACTLSGYLGPDIVSLHEQLFCDSNTKTLWKFCQPRDDNNSTQDGASTDVDLEGCYDKNELSLVKAGKLHKRSYVKRQVWEMNGDVVVDGVVVNKGEAL